MYNCTHHNKWIQHTVYYRCTEDTKLNQECMHELMVGQTLNSNHAITSYSYIPLHVAYKRQFSIDCLYI